MNIKISHKDFLVAFYAKLLKKNKFACISSFLNFDKSIKQLRKDLFKKKYIYMEILVSRLWSRRFINLGGPHILFLFNKLDQISLIPVKYRESVRFIISNNTVYPGALYYEISPIKNLNLYPLSLTTHFCKTAVFMPLLLVNIYINIYSIILSKIAHIKSIN